jgi:AcrR family transcriptional regulator
MSLCHIDHMVKLTYWSHRTQHPSEAMAQINLKRRAEIGAAKRARTRAVILKAAHDCYGAAAADNVTVDAVMQAAGLAKGTFYVHFEDLAGLEAEVGSALVSEIDDRLQPVRLALADPFSRIAAAITILLNDLAAVPSRARLAARAAARIPDLDWTVQAHLQEDLAAALAAGRLALPSKELAARVVSAIVTQAATDFGQGRLGSKVIPDIVRAILRAIGCAPAEAAKHTAQAERNADRFARRGTRAGRFENQESAQ